MLVIIILVSSDKLINPPDKPTALAIGETDLSRSLIQAVAVASYLALLLAVKPYVHSRLRRWKMWVTAANQGTALLLLLARMLAEQASAQAYHRASVSNDTMSAAVDSEPQPAIFMASYVFIYIATLCCMLQFVVLFGCFFWSMLLGAKREQVVIVKQKEAVRQAKERGGATTDVAWAAWAAAAGVAREGDDDDEGTMGKVGISMLDNPMRQGAPSVTVKSERKRRLTQLSRFSQRGIGSADFGDDAARVAAEEKAAWTDYIDGESGKKCWYNTLTGETKFDEEEDEEEQDIDEEQEEQEDEEEQEEEGLYYGAGEEDDDQEETDGLMTDEEEEEEVDHTDELMKVRSRLRGAMQISEDGTDSLADQAYLDLVNDTRGDWVEVCDADGSVLGDALAGHTVYYNRESYETRLSKPSGWVRLQAQALSQDLNSARAESIRIMSLAASRKSKSKGKSWRQSADYD